MLAAASGLSFAAALASPFPIREVGVVGTSRLDPAVVRAASGLEGANVFRASSAEAMSRIAAIPAVRRVRVALTLPGRALIEVEERMPAIVVALGEGRLFADEAGALFAAGGTSEGLAVLDDETGRRGPGERIDPALVRATRDIAAHEPAYFGRRIERVRLTARLGLVVRLDGGTELRLGTPDQLDLKLEAARRIVLARAGKRLDYVDVRSLDGITFFPTD